MIYYEMDVINTNKNKNNSSEMLNLFASDDIINESQDICCDIEYKKKSKEKLLKKKTYYKTLFHDYKKFIKKINLPNTETSNAVSYLTKFHDKTTIYNITDMQNKLYENIKNIKKNLYFISENFNKKILILDGENILKSFKYQQLIKLYLTQEKYDFYFNFWFNGSIHIQPMTSLNLLISDKIILIDILIKNYLIPYNCIIILSGKTNIDSSTTFFICDNQSFIIPIIYNKEDIREQDDHLLLYIYYHFNKIKNCDIISSDKFKWFNSSENYIKNFIFEYNFDEKKISINIANSYTNDIIIYNKHKYQLGYYYFPFIQNFSIISTNDDLNILSLSQLENKISHLIENKEYLSIIIFVLKIFLFLIDLNSNYDENDIQIKIYSDTITYLVSKIIISFESSFNIVIDILHKVSSIHKKKLYNYSLFFNDFNQCTQIQTNINDYCFCTELYLILKSLTFLVNCQKTIIKISKLFSYIINVYDKIDFSIHKLRKISNNNDEFGKIFNNILSHYIFMKKNGFCKKDY
jgi:hypothetical protein